MNGWGVKTYCVDRLLGNRSQCVGLYSRQRNQSIFSEFTIHGGIKMQADFKPASRNFTNHMLVIRGKYVV